MAAVEHARSGFLCGRVEGGAGHIWPARDLQYRSGIAAIRRQSEIAIGNIIGSNIFNVLGILGVTALITPIPVASRFLTFDLPVMIAASLLLTVLLLTRPVIGRGVGVAMLAGYIIYVWAAQG